MADKINEFKKAFDEHMKNGLKEGDQPDEALRCMIEEAESVFETIGELTEYKSFTGTKTVEGLTNDLYSKTIGLLNFIKVFSDEYTARMELAEGLMIKDAREKDGRG